MVPMISFYTINVFLQPGSGQFCIFLTPRSEINTFYVIKQTLLSYFRSELENTSTKTIRRADLLISLVAE